MVIYKIVAIAIITLFIYLLFSSGNSKSKEITSAVSIAFTVVVIGIILYQFRDIIFFVRDISTKANVDLIYLGIVLKILVISFLCSFTSDICKDAGAQSIGAKVEFAGKILILGLSIPILRALLDAIIKIL